MTEVEKMYENANIKKDRMCEWTCRGSEYCSTNCEHYESTQLCYPPFTAEKQLELIKWLSTKELKIRTNKQPYAVYVGVLGNDNTCFYGCGGLYLEQTLSELINHLWQSLTEEERKQIKNILESEVRE